MKMKKIISAVITIALLAAMLTGCKSPSSSDTSGTSATPGAQATPTAAANETPSGGAAGTPAVTETEPVIFYVPGDEPAELAAALEVINAKLKEDGAGVELTLTYVPWDAWDQKINLMLSIGESFDLFQVMNDRVSLSNYASRGALYDITDIMNEYGQNILNVCPQIMISSASVKSRIYAIPAYWVETALDPEITIRKDILEKYGQNVPTTFEEMTEAFENIMENWEGNQKPYIPLSPNGSVNFGINQKTYDEWPFVIYDKVFFVGQDGVVKNTFETDVFRKNCENARLWYEKGLINPDAITVTSDQINNQLDSGDWFVHCGTIGDITKLKTNYPDITVDDFIAIDFAPEKPRIRPYGTRNMNAVPAASEHPEAAVRFLNWLYGSQENYDLFLYGREGTDYKLLDDGGIQPIVNEATSQPLYSFADWIIGNINFTRTSSTMPKSTIASLYTMNETAVEGYAAQFTFDASTVQTEYADVMTVISSDIVPIGTGIKDYDSNIDKVLEKLKAAGVDKLIEEFQKQLDASKQQ